ncbi:MAG: GNAT family N-acetyltransferase [Granulosicoccus sp.]
MHIRREQPEDHLLIHQLTAEAFAPMTFSDGTEPDIIDKLRAAGNLSISLVALKNYVLVGHVAFSPVSIGDVADSWYGLGPVSVQPGLQRTGIGSALINDGLRKLENMGAAGCALIGDPNYYCRFGFVSDGSIHYEGLPDKHVQWKSFGKQHPEGFLVFSPEFDD